MHGPNWTPFFPPTFAFISLTFGIHPDFLLGLLIINSTGVYKPVVICFDFIVFFMDYGYH